MAVTLLWPALLMVLIGAPATVMLAVAMTSIAAACSHPYAAVVLAFIVFVAMASAIVRPESRKASLGYGLALGALMLARTLARLDPYESQALGVQTIVMSFNDSLLGWPIVAIALTLVAALGSLLGTRQRAHIFLTQPLIIAGLALIVWAIHPANWANCNDYRYWVAPISMLFMSGAAVEELWLRRLPEPQLQNLRLYAVPLIGAIFLLSPCDSESSVGNDEPAPGDRSDELGSRMCFALQCRLDSEYRAGTLGGDILRGRTARPETKHVVGRRLSRVPTLRAQRRRNSCGRGEFQIRQIPRERPFRFRGRSIENCQAAKMNALQPKQKSATAKR